MIKIIFALLLSCFTVVAYAETADHVVVVKSEKKLYLEKNGKVFASYPVVFGSNPKGHKEKQGDGRTPEGSYIIDKKNEKVGYYKPLHISYPNEKDIAAAKAKGVDPGGRIYIHGQKNGYGWAERVTQAKNWTKGCIALTNKDMKKVWDAVNAGTPIDIKP
jgi:murein L,D-transpeptidase YafK